MSGEQLLHLASETPEVNSQSDGGSRCDGWRVQRILTFVFYLGFSIPSVIALVRERAHIPDHHPCGDIGQTVLLGTVLMGVELVYFLSLKWLIQSRRSYMGDFAANIFVALATARLFLYILLARPQQVQTECNREFECIVPFLYMMFQVHVWLTFSFLVALLLFLVIAGIVTIVCRRTNEDSSGHSELPEVSSV